MRKLIGLILLLVAVPAFAGDYTAKAHDNLSAFLTVGEDSASVGARWKYFGGEIGQWDNDIDPDVWTYELLGFVPFRINEYPLRLKLGVGLAAMDAKEYNSNTERYYTVTDREFTGSLGVEGKLNEHVLLGVGYSADRDWNLLLGYAW